MIQFLTITETSFPTVRSEIKNLDAECFPNIIWEFDHWANLFKNYYIKIILAQESEEHVGFVAFSNIGDEIEIFKIGVEPTHRNMSIGKQLIENMIKIADLQGSKTVFLEVRAENKNAIQLYQKCGFKLVHKRKNYYQNPTGDALVFQLDV